MKKLFTLFLIGYLVHMSFVELYYIQHISKMDSCITPIHSDGTFDPDVSECLEKVDAEQPSFIVSPRLYRYFHYKNYKDLK